MKKANTIAIKATNTKMAAQGDHFNIKQVIKLKNLDFNKII